MWILTSRRIFGFNTFKKGVKPEDYAIGKEKPMSAAPKEEMMKKDEMKEDEMKKDEMKKKRDEMIKKVEEMKKAPAPKETMKKGE